LTLSSPLQDNGKRRYEIRGVVGIGGFGTVYRARLLGPTGFTKDVAIKLLHNTAAPESMVKRFRDEARILGLIRDRAVLSVEPPVVLDGQWAVVTEFVDGCSLRTLVKQHGSLPLGPTLEVVMEVARALDNCFHYPGPDGRPLQLLHRDIKPGNIQVTPAGEVKLLDFGIARADFDEREAHTVATFTGTPGYIAPERLKEEESAAGDIYSLGVVLYVLLMGDRPDKVDPPTDPSDTLRHALALSERMRGEPPERPNARQLERFCDQLIRRAQGVSLRDWAEGNVPRASELDPDERVGSVITETDATLDAPPAPDRRPLLIAGALFMAGFSITLLTGGAITTAYVLNQAAPPTEQVPFAPVQPERIPQPVQPMPEPELEPEPEPAAIPQPARPASTVPSPAPSRPAPAPVIATFDVMISSVPLGADVTVDGTDAGVTPLVDFTLTKGQHEVAMTFADGRTSSHVIQVGPRLPDRFIWRIDDQRWESEY
jgi:serine/threonine protein kinase